MDLLAAFEVVWSGARATFGEGNPHASGHFERARRLLQPQSDVASTPGGRWTGAAADAYALANGLRDQALVTIAGLDRDVAAVVDQVGAVVIAARRDLGTVREWVRKEGSSLPPTADGQRMLELIVGNAASDVEGIVERSERYFDEAERRVRGLDYETVPGTRPHPIGEVLTDEEWQIARNSPTLLSQWTIAQHEGWRVEFNPGGSFTNKNTKLINVDPKLRNGRRPEAVVLTLAHELGHVRSPQRIDRSSNEAYVNSWLSEEGAATLNSIEIEREILKAGGPEGRGIIASGLVYDNVERIYDTYKATGSTPEGYQAAIVDIGQRHGDLRTSTDPAKTYRESHGYYFDKHYIGAGHE